MQSVTSRTVGYVTLYITQLHYSSTLIIMLLMFIGGGSLSTASGIKVGTFIILLAAVYSYIRHRKEVVLFKRSISPDTIQKSLALLLANRSEEHTSELQSLMRISYAVFCLKKKKTNNTHNNVTY